VETPVTKVLIYDVDGVVLKGAVETSGFEDFPQDADGVYQVGEGGEGEGVGEKRRVVVVLEGWGIRDLLRVRVSLLLFFFPFFLSLGSTMHSAG
jgi:hypothetical protein